MIKKIFLLCFVVIMSVSVCMAKPANKKTKTTTVFVTNIVCHNCVNKIMNNIPVLGGGIDDVKVDLPTKEVTITYYTSKNSDEKIIKNFEKLKIKATPKEKTDANAPKSDGTPCTEKQCN